MPWYTLIYYIWFSHLGMHSFLTPEQTGFIAKQSSQTCCWWQILRSHDSFLLSIKYIFKVLDLVEHETAKIVHHHLLPLPCSLLLLGTNV